MKFSTSIVSSILAVAGTVSAGIFSSPTEGQVLTSSSPINFTFDAGRIFKESTNSVSVLLAPAHLWPGTSNSQAATLIDDMKPTGISDRATQIFSAQLSPKFLSGTNPSTVPGNWSLIVVERYNAFGGNSATALSIQSVTFSN